MFAQSTTHYTHCTERAVNAINQIHIDLKWSRRWCCIVNSIIRESVEWRHATTSRECEWAMRYVDWWVCVCRVHTRSVHSNYFIGNVFWSYNIILVRLVFNYSLSKILKFNNISFKHKVYITSYYMYRLSELQKSINNNLKMQLSNHKL